jgi:hypothetical protein
MANNPSTGSRLELHEDYVETFSKLEISTENMVYILSFGQPTQSIKNMFVSKIKGSKGKLPIRSDLLVLKMCLALKRSGHDLTKVEFSAENEMYFSK